MNNIYPLTLLYDGSCPVCLLEMDHLRSRNEAGRLVFVDISAPGFEAAAYGATLDEMNAAIHAVPADGGLIKGVQVLWLAYDAVGLGWVMSPVTWGPLRGLSEVAYRAFARHRQSLSCAAGPVIRALRAWRARTVAASMGRCASGACATPSGAEHAAHTGSGS